MGYAPESSTWEALLNQVEPLVSAGIPRLFESDPERGSRYQRSAADLFVDFSRQLVDDQAFEGLLELARITEVPAAIHGMFAGEEINVTEHRPALHVALRRPADGPLMLQGEDVMALVVGERRRMAKFVNAVHDGEITGFSGLPMTDVVNIGIGGSDLGIVMAVAALAEYRHDSINVHCVSNIDGVDLNHTLAACDPATTLFIVCSKSFTTLETQTNANTARQWLLAAGGDAAVAKQFAAVSTNHPAMDAFGIHPEFRFTIWDWVGGRFSVWSAVGLALALAIGWQHFEEFLAGGHDLDEHFETADLANNLPVLLALIGVWNRNFVGLPALAVLPYDQHLARFPAFLQQLEMESNGKTVRRNGDPVATETCPLVFGEPGSNAQHSFYQLLHQGSPMAAMDFILPAQSAIQQQPQQDLAIANCLAQAQAFAEGRSSAEIVDSEPDLVGHKVHSGSRPSTLIALSSLGPRTLGQLMGLYEHKVYVQSIIWDVNAFDQWGVELGKTLAQVLAPLVTSNDPAPSPLVADALAMMRSLR